MATITFLVTKFTSGAWVTVIAIPALIVLFTRIGKYYANAGAELGLGTVPQVPHARKSLVVVAVTGVSRMTEAALEAALSLGDEVLAVSVQFDDDKATVLRTDWDRWKPGVRLVILHPQTRSVTAPILDYLGSPEIRAHRQVLVLLPEVEPSKWRHRILQNQRDIILAHALRRHGSVNVASVPFRLTDD